MHCAYTLYRYAHMPWVEDRCVVTVAERHLRWKYKNRLPRSTKASSTTMGAAFVVFTVLWVAVSLFACHFTRGSGITPWEHMMEFLKHATIFTLCHSVNQWRNSQNDPGIHDVGTRTFCLTLGLFRTVPHAACILLPPIRTGTHSLPRANTATTLMPCSTMRGIFRYRRSTYLFACCTQVNSAYRRASSAWRPIAVPWERFTSASL